MTFFSPARCQPFFVSESDGEGSISVERAQHRSAVYMRPSASIRRLLIVGARLFWISRDVVPRTLPLRLLAKNSMTKTFKNGAFATSFLSDEIGY